MRTGRLWKPEPRRVSDKFPFHPEGVKNVGLMSVLVNVSIAVHFPVRRHQGDCVVVVVQVARHSEGKLFHGVDARNGTRLRFRGIQRGEKEAGKDRYDCNDDKEFYQSKF